MLDSAGVHLGIISGLPTVAQLQTQYSVPLYLYRPLLSCVSLLSLPYALQALSMTELNGPGPQVTEPQIAMFCGRQLLHMNLQTSQWEPDPQGHQGCFKEPSEILSYCQEVGKSHKYKQL